MVAQAAYERGVVPAAADPLSLMLCLCAADTGVVSALSVAEQAISESELETFLGKGLRARLLVQEEPTAVVVERERAEPVLLSPELVLVCPELRELALQQLPERDPDCFRPGRRLEQSSEDVSRPIDSDSPSDEWELPEVPLRVGADKHTEDSPDPPLVLSLLAYTVQQSVRMAVQGAGLIAAASGLIVLLAQFHR
jgi:hypothetical protein